MVLQNIPISLDKFTTLELGHLKATTRTVQQKRVYGKRKTNAPRAVLDDGSPKSDAKKSQIGSRKPYAAKDDVGEVEEKLAAIKIDDGQLKTKEVREEQTIATPAIGKKRRTSVKKQYTSPKRKQAPASTSSHKSPQSDAKSDISAKHNTPRRPPSTPKSALTKTPQKRPVTCLSSGCVPDEKTNAYCRSILHEAMSSLAAQGVQKFGSWAARSESTFDAVKIAEGSYGEVYKLRFKEDVCRRDMSKSKLSKLRAYGEGVFKIVPLRAQQGAGSKKFTRIDEIAAEVKLLKLLDPIPGFARFREVHVVQGRFPESFQKAWNTYKLTKDDCMNPSPANKRAYAENQLWAILEMDDAGVELEKFPWSSVFQVYDIFWGVAMALARAEEFALFEVCHRLHGS
jgi:serine/threonine-protein kinase haspin